MSSAAPYLNIRLCDPLPFKASAGLFHTTDLCFQSGCLKDGWLTGKAE